MLYAKHIDREQTTEPLLRDAVVSLGLLVLSHAFVGLFGRYCSPTYIT